MASTSNVAIVTGGADGFGAAIVDRFRQEGSAVIFIDLNRSKGEAKARTDSQLHYICGDVTLRETWEEALSVAQTNYGRIDVVVNNAGITFDASPIHTKSINEYEKTFNVNVKPIFLSTQVIAPVMLASRQGSFINITSTGCTRPRPGFAIYNASKAAVETATKTFALEYAPTIRFNCIAPALGNTSMLQASIGNDKESQERRRNLEKMIPMQRVTEPSDVANAVWFLASGQSSFVTGITFPVDGGRGV